MLHPAQPLGRLDVLMRGKRFGIVEGPGLHFRDAGQKLLVAIEEAGSAVRAEVAHRRSGRVEGFHLSLVDGELIVANACPAHDRSAGIAAAVGAVAKIHVNGLALDMVADGAAMAAAGVGHDSLPAPTLYGRFAPRRALAQSTRISYAAPVSDVSLSFLDPGDGPRIAFRMREGESPTLMFLPGYASDMEGAKALALDAFAEERGLSMLRFDYSGTGSSEGEFEQGTLERWADEATLLLDEITRGPVILIGSSMGGWLALHLALRRPDRVAALVGIAAAPDFTEWGFPDHLKQRLTAGETLRRPLPDGSEQVTTSGFWLSGQAMRLLEREIAVDCPVRLVHGDRDEDVPLDVAFRLKEAVRSADVQVLVLKGGGHRLSAPHEIRAILRAVEGLLEPSQ